MRLIDADALKHHYSWWGTEVGDGTSKYEREVFDSIVDAQPTIEAVPVIRCKDCKHCDITEVFDAKTAKSRQELFCMRYGMDIPGDWYCADGEKVTE